MPKLQLLPVCQGATLNYWVSAMPEIDDNGSVELVDIVNVGVGFGILQL